MIAQNIRIDSGTHRGSGETSARKTPSVESGERVLTEFLLLVTLLGLHKYLSTLIKGRHKIAT
jgi:hypothetical protein